MPTFKSKMPTFKSKMPTFKSNVPTFKSKMPTCKSKMPTFKSMLPTFRVLCLIFKYVPISKFSQLAAKSDDGIRGPHLGEYCKVKNIVIICLAPPL